MKLVFMIGCCFYAVFGFGQAEVVRDSIADELKNEARQLSKIGEYRKSDSLLLIARRRYKEKRIWNNWYVTIIRSDANRSKQRKFEENIKELERFYEEVPMDSIYIRARLLFIKATNHQNLGDILTSVKLYKESRILLELCKRTNGQDRFYDRYITIVHKNIANGYSKLNDQISALNYLNEYKELIKSKEDSCKFWHLKARYHFYNQEYQESQKYFSKAAKSCDDSQAEGFLVDIYSAQGDVKNARIFLDSLEKRGSTVDYNIAKAIFESENQNYKSAIASQSEAIAEIEADPNYVTRKIFREYLGLAQYYEKDQNLDEAVKAAQMAINIAQDTIGADIYTRPQMGQKVLDVSLIEAIYIKAKFFVEKYVRSGDNVDLIEAKYYFNELCQQQEKLKKTYYSNSAKYKMGDHAAKMYKDIVSFYLLLYQQEGQFTDLNNSFLYSQYASSFVLKNAVSERKMLELINLPQDSIDEYLELVQNVTTNSDIEDLNVIKAYDQFRENLKFDYPIVENYTAQTEVSVDRIQAGLDSSELLLKYSFIDSNLIIFAISQNDMKLYIERLPDDFSNIINLYKSQVLNPSKFIEEEYLRIAHNLYKLLLQKPISDEAFKSKRSLIFVLDGPIKSLPISTLVQKESSKLSPEDYVIWTYDIRYLYYSSQLLRNTRDKRYTKGGFVGFGLEYEDRFLKDIIEEHQLRSENRANYLKPLKYAVDEVLASASYFSGQVYINEEATASNALKHLDDYQLAHVSAHALVEEENFLDSYIAFNATPGLDYKMTYQDIISRKQKSDLVVLSACQTGIGKEISSEGAMSLSRAFIEGGARSVVGSYWNVSDRSTKEIMKLFYQNIKNGNSKARALRLAQKEYLTNDDISTPSVRLPFYWGAWALYGDDTPVKVSKFIEFRPYLIAGIGILLLILVFYLYQLAKSKKDRR